MPADSYRSLKTEAGLSSSDWMLLYHHIQISVNTAFAQNDLSGQDWHVHMADIIDAEFIDSLWGPGKATVLCTTREGDLETIFDIITRTIHFCEYSRREASRQKAASSRLLAPRRRVRSTDATRRAAGQGKNPRAGIRGQNKTNEPVADKTD